MRQEIEDLLRQLPLREGLDDIRVRYAAEMIVGQHTTSSENTGIKAFKEVSPKAAAGQLRQLGKNLDDLYDTIYRFSATAHAALESTRDEIGGSSRPSTILLPVYLDDRYPKLAQAARVAADRLPNDTSGNRGRKIGKQAQDMANSLASTFYALTGRRPKRGGLAPDGTETGPFFRLVAQVFKRCGIRGAPETYTRQAVKEFKNRNGENWL